MRYEKKSLAAVCAAVGMMTGISRGQTYDSTNSFVYLSSNLPDGSATPAQESQGEQSLLVPLSINDNGLIAGYYRAYQSASQTNLEGYPTGIVLSTTANVATPGNSVVTFTQVAGVTSYTGDDLPSVTGYPSGYGDENWAFGINSAGTVAGSAEKGEWPSIATPSPTYPTYASQPVTADGLPLVTASQDGTTSQTNGPFGGGNFFSPPSGLGMAIDNAGDLVGGAYGTASTHQMNILVDPANTGLPVNLNAVPYTYFATGTTASTPISSLAYGIDPNSNMSAGNATVVGVSTPYHGVNSLMASSEKSATVWTESGGAWTAQLLPSLYTGGSGTTIGQSIAYGVATVNGIQEVIGVSDTTGEPAATVWLNGVPQDLDGSVVGSHSTLSAPYGTSMLSYNNGGANPKDANQPANRIESIADAINSSGDIVGYSYAFPGEGKTAVLWQPTGLGTYLPIDLNAYLPAYISAEYPGAYLEEATGINDNGQIVGYGIDTAATTFGFELNPIGTVAVPEPTGVVALLAVAGLLGRRSRDVRR
jgi:hypothetical protein